MPKRPDIRLFRVYDVDDGSVEGYRILVDRLWPRGVSKSDAALDEWLKDVAPSTDLPAVVQPRRHTLPGVRSPLPQRAAASIGIRRNRPPRRARPNGHGHPRYLHPRCRTLGRSRAARQAHEPQVPIPAPRVTSRCAPGGPVGVSTTGSSRGSDASTTDLSDVVAEPFGIEQGFMTTVHAYTSPTQWPAAAW